MYGIGVSDNEVANNARTFCCEAGRFPLKFLGAPVKANMSLKRNWPPIIERIWLNPFLVASLYTYSLYLRPRNLL